MLITSYSSYGIFGADTEDSLARQRHTRQEECLVNSELLSESNVAEVLFALPDGDDFTTLAEDLDDELLGGVLRQAAHKHRLTARRALPGGRRGKV